MPIDLDNGGHVVVSGSAGMFEPDYHDIFSIKVQDPRMALSDDAKL